MLKAWLMLMAWLMCVMLLLMQLLFYNKRSFTTKFTDLFDAVLLLTSGAADVKIEAKLPILACIDQ